MKYILIVGKIDEGMRFVGPFDSKQAAFAYADGPASEQVCQIVTLEAPIEV